MVIQRNSPHLKRIQPHNVSQKVLFQLLHCVDGKVVCECQYMRIHFYSSDNNSLKFDKKLIKDYYLTFLTPNPFSIISLQYNIPRNSSDQVRDYTTVDDIFHKNYNNKKKCFLLAIYAGYFMQDITRQFRKKIHFFCNVQSISSQPAKIIKECITLFYILIFKKINCSKG